MGDQLGRGETVEGGLVRPVGRGREMGRPDVHVTRLVDADAGAGRTVEADAGVAEAGGDRVAADDAEVLARWWCRPRASASSRAALPPVSCRPTTSVPVSRMTLSCLARWPSTFVPPCQRFQLSTRSSRGSMPRSRSGVTSSRLSHTVRPGASAIGARCAQLDREQRAGAQHGGAGVQQVTQIFSSSPGTGPVLAPPGKSLRPLELTAPRTPAPAPSPPRGASAPPPRPRPGTTGRPCPPSDPGPTPP